MARFNLEEYATVEERLTLYKKDFPDYRIKTELIYYSPEGEIVVLATIFKNVEDQKNNLFHSTGIAAEVPDGMVNRTSRIENGETSAIGRALANAGYQIKKRPSKEEMQKVERLSSSELPVTDIKDPSSDIKLSDLEDYTEIIDTFTTKSELTKWYSNKKDEFRDNPDLAALFQSKYKPLVQNKLPKLK